MSAPPRPYQSGIVIAAPFVRIIREPGGQGWLTITAKGHAWLHGDRRAALEEQRWFSNQWRGRS
jgi:hypothetical protein